ncbi:MAG: sugar phosphate isomerase/epimerase family protein [Anaerolineae bacterium]|nr:sugar phosphate isomerase/epimerase [Thermoflexales bacterium]MDW8407041.1 sugar phosphate isomerase/epimerase family protein [Anaerolineae bacterium]
MRLGMSGCFLPSNMDDLTPEVCRRVRALGFSGIFTRFRDNHPLHTPKSKADRVRQIMADEGVHLYQCTGFWQNLITPDEAQRREAVRVLQAALRLAGWLGARGVDTGPGSMNPAGPWFPHPYNWTPIARQQLVKSLREAAPAAEDAGVYLSLEGHQLVTLESAEVAREVLDEVSSPWVKQDYDSANWITRETVYNTTAAIHHHFDVLGDRIISCHAKDIWIENRLTVHLQDGCPGQGTVDFKTLFRRMEALNPDYPVIAEGNTTEELPAVSALFHRIAAELGIRVVE